MQDEADDNALLAAIATGDRVAFRRLMERHGPGMLALAQRITGSEADADEVVQESFLKVWRFATKWDPRGTARFGTWFYRVVVNASLDRCRRMRHAPLEAAGDPADPAPGGFDVAMARQCRQAVADSLAGLPERQRAALSLCYFGEVSAPQAARILDLSLPAVEALLVRGRRALRKALMGRGITRLGDVL